mgnify:CR=1 FL=1
MAIESLALFAREILGRHDDDGNLAPGLHVPQCRDEGRAVHHRGGLLHLVPELAQQLGLDVDTFMDTLNAYNAACRVGQFDHTRLDDCHTDGLTPPKTHWARPIDTAPFYAYAVRPGVTFTYLGLHTDDSAAVRFAGQPSDNLFVAGEMMAGNVLGQGYTAGVGMSIGTAFGRISGEQAARAALGTPASVPTLAQQVMQGSADMHQHIATRVSA